MNDPIALLSDFGHADPYVGVMKGVILSRAPKATIVDLCHGIGPQDVRAAAFALRSSVSFFPKGTLFVAVVDPEVGSGRRILWAKTARHTFLAPDNGLLAWLDDDKQLIDMRALMNKSLWLPEVSETFHGRDIFAAVAGRLARGLAPARLGPRIVDMMRLRFPGPTRNGGRVKGEILVIDRFGNAVTNLRREHMAPGVKIYFGGHGNGRGIGPVADFYAGVSEGKSLTLFGSSGYLELSIRNGDFARRYRARPGDKVYVGR